MDGGEQLEDCEGECQGDGTGVGECASVAGRLVVAGERAADGQHQQHHRAQRALRQQMTRIRSGKQMSACGGGANREVD